MGHRNIPGLVMKTAVTTSNIVHLMKCLTNILLVPFKAIVTCRKHRDQGFLVAVHSSPVADTAPIEYILDFQGVKPIKSSQKFVSKEDHPAAEAYRENDPPTYYPSIWSECLLTGSIRAKFTVPTGIFICTV